MDFLLESQKTSRGLFGSRSALRGILARLLGGWSGE
jgi:hypothetical protein